MASTYSSIKIQLMATGENNTTWGDVTNLNLGTAIEEAIVGSADVTFASADVTLTLTDTNASQTARNMRLRCTGTTGGSTRNLIVPSIEKPYIVRNDCADSVQVKTAAGTGITIPAGKTMWVYSDGTNVVDVVTRLSSLTLGTALAVADGGTGSNTASGARTNLGLGSIATQSASNVSITGGSITGITDLDVADGGTGASTASGARTNLGLGSLAVLSTIDNSNWSGTALAVTNGGTGATTATTARTNLGATTVGGNLFTLTNPSAITFPRFNADNTVSALDASTFRTAIGAGTGSGTVTSVAFSTGSTGLSVSGSPITTSGTLTLSGTLVVANGGTGSTTAAGARTNLGAAASGANTDITSLNPTGGLQVGAPTGGAQGTGTINATGLFVNGVAVGTGSGSVSSVNASGGTTGLTFSGGPITTSGTLTMAGTLAVANGGTGSNTASGARTALGLAIGTDVPSPTGTGASGTWAINISGSAATATSATSAGTATNASALVTSNFSIVESGGVLYIKYGATNIAKITSAGAFTALNNVTGYGTV